MGRNERERGGKETGEKGAGWNFGGEHPERRWELWGAVAAVTDGPLGRQRREGDLGWFAVCHTVLSFEYFFKEKKHILK